MLLFDVTSNRIYRPKENELESYGDVIATIVTNID